MPGVVAGVQCTVDDQLLAEAGEVLGTGTATETVEVGLREVIRQRRRAALRAALGATDLGMTRDELLRQRRREALRHLPTPGPDQPAGGDATD